ncbi:MAG TPA: metallophosphoesterase [Gemmatimonadales bacterium]|nr:metallophosphoesterase [Gemmatimonadales bacterium]
MPSPVSRRKFLLTATGALAAAAVGDALLIEPTAIQVTRHELPLPGLGPALDGLRVACITDVHLHRGIGPAARAALEALARERPDVVLLSGDMCNKRDDLPELVAWTREARGTLATFATLGNWEHDAGIDRRTAERAYERAGAELLYNSAARVTRSGATVTIVGIDDPVLGEPDLAAALATVRSGDPVLWTLHAPGYVDGVPRDTTPRPAAILAGHTHGGQIRLPFYTPHTPRGSGRFVAGWYRDTLAPLYVTRGIGTVLIQARLFCPPELPIFTLRT